MESLYCTDVDVMACADDILSCSRNGCLTKMIDSAGHIGDSSFVDHAVLWRGWYFMSPSPTYDASNMGRQAVQRAHWKLFRRAECSLTRLIAVRI